ncbi:MAG: hypothetical protein ACXVJO_14225, partial [Thermoanaerobaculia bacterium]
MPLRVSVIVSLVLSLVSLAVPLAIADPCPPPQPAIHQIVGISPSCPGALVTLEADAGYASYLWSTGATTRTISDTPTASTEYTVTVTGDDGCTATSEPL